ncbi:disease resistance protein RGA2-like [Musa acuminata AAA Group]|uniref:disease resistance protein RGA2-like n=1 Tax=Musa acuminata AAA Group TaxID=214697 RepID=UPI0031DE98E6
MAQGRLLGMPNHMEMIRDRLWAINGTIKDAEHRALKEPELEEWVTDVGAAIVDVDDLLGRILDWHPRGGAAAASNRSSHSICSIREASRQAILLELKEMVGRLNYLVRRGSVLGLWKEILESVDPRQEEEYSTVLREEVVGRNEDVEKIIDILQQQQQSGDGVEWLLIDGEDGRTTLARLIYHHPWVREQFQHRIWVDVSKVAYLDPTMIMREFTSSITGEPCEDIWLFFDGIHGSKYLLVLDDLNIGEEDRDKWSQLESFLLLVGAPGSTVVVVPFFNSRLIESVLGSTRLIESIILGSTDLVFTQYKWGSSSVRKYELGSLSKDDWVKLCMRQALIRPDQHEQANAIIQLCNSDYSSSDDGSPVFAKVFGSPMFAKVFGTAFRYAEMNRWQQRIDEHGHDYVFNQVKERVNNQVMALIVSHCLSRKWTRFMLYGWLIRHGGDMVDYKDLLHVLAAEGLLPYSVDEGMTGENAQLRVSNETYSSITITKYCYTLSAVDSNSTIPRQCLHLRILVDSNTIVFPNAFFDGVNMLRSLVLQPEQMDHQHKYQILDIPKGMFNNLIHVRILYLRAIRVQQLPDTVGKLLILRYLNLSQSEIQALPESLCKLKNLRVLNLAHCEKLRKLPKRIHNLENLHILKLAYCTKLQRLPISVTGLINLRELDLESCQWLVELPEGLSNLKKLIDLNVYRCPLNQMSREISQMSNLMKLYGYIKISDIGNVFSELQSLMNLKELVLQNLEQVSNSEDALKLHDVLPRLRYLRLNWKWDNTDDMRTSELVSLQVLENFRPNPNLKKLEIILYASEEFPEWIKNGFDCLHKLKWIKLINLKKCKRLPSLGGLHDLKIIEISGMDLINAMDEAFYGENENGTFPNLEKLILSDMPALEKWLKVERRERLFPRLGELTLIQCPKFKALEVDLEVTRLSIWLNNKMLRTSEFKGWHNLQSIEHLEIVGCQEMRRLPQDMERCDRLHKLRIIGCDNLDCLPEWLQGFESLKYLCMYGCRALSFMPEKLKRFVEVKGCPKLRR